MDTSLALQDPGLLSLSGRSSAASGNTESNGLFASTLQQELDDPGAEGSEAPGATVATDPSPRTLRKDLGDWLRTLQAGAASASLPAEAAGEAVASTENPAAPLAAMLTGSSRFNPLPDAAESGTDAEGDGELLEPADEAMIALEPASPAIAASPLPPAIQPHAAPSTAGILPGQFRVARTVSTGEPPSSTATLPDTAAADLALPDRPQATTPAHEHRWSGLKTAWQDSNAVATAAAGNSDAVQQPQANVLDSVLRFVSPQPVLAPELDQGFAQQLAAGVSALRPADAGSSSPGSTTTVAEPLPFSLQSEIPAGSEGWGEDIGNRIAWLSEQKISKAELTLHPAELGALDITINSENDRVTVTIVTRNDAARELLQDNLPRLAELLRNNGLALEQGSVSQHSAGDRGAQPDSKSGADSSPETSSNAGTDLPRLRSALLHQGQIDHYV